MTSADLGYVGLTDRSISLCGTGSDLCVRLIYASWPTPIAGSKMGSQQGTRALPDEAAVRSGHPGGSAGEREGTGELHHVLGQVDSANSTVRVNAARPIPLLAWTAMPLLKATM